MRLRTAFLTSIPQEWSQFEEVEPRFVFRPVGHVRALDPNAMLVTGIRGSGKSFWWHALQNETIRKAVLTAQQAVTTSAGFGEGDDQTRPGSDVLESLLDEGHPARLIWKAVVVRHVAGASQIHLRLPDTWKDLVAWVRSDAERVADVFRDADLALSARRQTHLVLFDALDRTASSDDRRRALLRGLLELVLELRPRASIRAKVFARPDMLDHADVRTFPDASKVLTTAVKLEWGNTDLYGLLFNYLGNARDGAAASAFRALSAGWRQRKVAWEMPDPLREDMKQQEQVFIALAGPYMGRNARRGKSYPWLPNHIGDALKQVSPRSFLAAMRRSAEVVEDGQTRALHWRGIQEGVRRASEVRTEEIKDDLPWAHEAMMGLVGVVVPCDRGTVLRKWTPRVASRPPSEVLEELVRVGVIAQLPDGRLNVPDLYRVGFGLRRKGGLPPA
jgi:hypothetical protein